MLNVEDVLAGLTLAEKISLLTGSDMWHTTSLDRLNIPPVRMTDGRMYTLVCDVNRIQSKKLICVDNCSGWRAGDSVLRRSGLELLSSEWQFGSALIARANRVRYIA